MEQIEIDNENNIYISPKKFIKLINDKCLDKLGRRAIENIYYSPNKKVLVAFTDGLVVNYESYRSAFDHLNIAYKLKLSIKNKDKKSQVFELDKENLSVVDIAKYKLETLIKSFKYVKNEKLNSINLDEYFNSSEWRKNDLNNSALTEIVSYLEKIQDNGSKKYVLAVKKKLFRT